MTGTIRPPVAERDGDAEVHGVRVDGVAVALERGVERRELEQRLDRRARLVGQVASARPALRATSMRLMSASAIVVQVAAVCSDCTMR